MAEIQTWPPHSIGVKGRKMAWCCGAAAKSKTSEHDGRKKAQEAQRKPGWVLSLLRIFAANLSGESFCRARRFGVARGSKTPPFDFQLCGG
jgi:hypothetical protein